MLNRFLLYFRKNISYINFCISLTTLTFQMGILNPWYKCLDNKFNNIDKKYDNMSIKIDNINTKINNTYDGKYNSTYNDTYNNTYNDKIDTISNKNNKNNSIYYKNDKKISYKEY